MDVQHSNVLTLVPGPVSNSSFQCMAWDKNGEVVCNTVIPQGNNGDMLRHWQYKHHSLPLRGLMFMDQTSRMILNISDFFKMVLVCGHWECGMVTYTNFLRKGGKLMETHYSEAHGQPGFSYPVLKLLLDTIGMLPRHIWSCPALSS